MLVDTAMEVTEVKPWVTNWDDKVGVQLLIPHTYIWSTALYSADTEKFRKEVIEKDGDDLLDQSRGKRSITQSQGGKKYPTYNKKESGRRLALLITACLGSAF
jgi:hypothetical protein